MDLANRLPAQEAINAAIRHGLDDPHAAIGVPRNATHDQVHKRMRQISLLVHPEKCSLPGAAEALDVVRSGAST